MKVIKLFLWVISILYLGFLCVLWGSTYWPPSVWWVANLFQMAPLWVLHLPIGFLIIIGMLTKYRRLLLTCFLSVLIIVFGIMGYNVPLAALIHKDGNAQHPLRIMTCNLGLAVDSTSLSELIKNTRPDIIFFQEVYSNNQNILEAILPQDTWNVTFQEYLGLASHLKIIHTDVKNRSIVGGTEGLVAKYTLEGTAGQIHVFNIHLETPRAGIQAMVDKNLYGLPEMVKVSQQQEIDSAIVSQWIGRHKSVLIAGDFNMPKNNPIYRRFWSKFTNAFSKAGLGFGYTSNTRWHGVRIDHILCDRDWRVIHSWVGSDIGSDHRPVIADVELVRKSSLRSQVEEPQEQLFSDTAALVFENFEMSLGKFENNGLANMYIDTRRTYLHGNTLKVERKTRSQYTSGIKLDLWRLHDYPMVSFAYMIPKGTPLGIRVKTRYNDWICLGKTASCRWTNPDLINEYILIDDGEWHEIHIDAQASVKSVLPKIGYLSEFQFYIDENRHQNDTFWIDDFRIGRMGEGLET